MKTINVILKKPGSLPEVTTIIDTLSELQRHVGGFVEIAMTHQIEHRRSVVWCDEEGLIKEPRPGMNVFRPSDRHPLFGGLVATALSPEGDNASLSARESAMWRAVLTACSPEASAWLASPQTKAHVESIFNDVDARDWQVIERALLFAAFPFENLHPAVRP